MTCSNICSFLLRILEFFFEWFTLFITLFRAHIVLIGILPSVNSKTFSLLMWVLHIVFIITKLQRLQQIQKNQANLPTEEHKILYYSLIESYIYYGITVYRAEELYAINLTVSFKKIINTFTFIENTSTEQ